MKISIIGRGINPNQHLTVGAIRALRAADKVIGIEPEQAAWANLQQEFGLPAIEDVSHLYENGARDQDNYNRFIAHVVGLSATCQNLVLLVAGHPRLGVTFIPGLQAALGNSAEVEVLEGISSFDVMTNQLAVDPLERGSVLLDANRTLLFNYELEPSLAYYIYHVCSVANSRTDYQDTPKANKVGLLRDYLLRSYAPEKTIYLCRGAAGETMAAKITPFVLRDFEAIAAEIDFATSLYIPAEKPRQLNKDYLNLLRN
jgi:uncharacterized protein YabN with tetrapyrrole methylase and pyrophosphatase domain